jgi:hypothetical protein
LYPTYRAAPSKNPDTSGDLYSFEISSCVANPRNPAFFIRCSKTGIRVLEAGASDMTPIVNMNGSGDASHKRDLYRAISPRVVILGADSVPAVSQ